MNKSEFEQRCVACAQKLHRIAMAILAREADAEDAVQEALVHAWMGLPRLREPRYFETWLCRILINECKRALRGRKRRDTGMLREAMPVPPPPNPGLWEALIRVEVRYRLPLTLHHVEGYSIRECADLMGLPQSTIKWRIHQGKKALGSLLGEEVEA